MLKCPLAPLPDIVHYHPEIYVCTGMNISYHAEAKQNKVQPRHTNTSYQEAIPYVKN